MTEPNIAFLIRELQQRLAIVDSAARYRPPTLADIEQMRGVAAAVVFRTEQLKLKMYQEPGHALPHLHVDYGKEHHVASYGINPAVRLAGNLNGRYDRTVVKWIEAHSAALTQFWDSMQQGHSSGVVLAELRDDA